VTTAFGPVNGPAGWTRGPADSNPAKDPTPDGPADRADEGGLTNYRSPASTRRPAFHLSAHPSYGIYFNKPATALSDGRARLRVWGKGVLEAIDYQTGKSNGATTGPNGLAGSAHHDSGLILPATRTATYWPRHQRGKTLVDAGRAKHAKLAITYELTAASSADSAGGLMFPGRCRSICVKLLDSITSHWIAGLSEMGLGFSEIPSSRYCPFLGLVRSAPGC